MRTGKQHNFYFSILIIFFAVLALMLTSYAQAADRYLVRYQEGAKAEILSLLGPDAVVHHEFDHLNLVAVTLSQGDASLLAAAPEVSSLEEDAPVYLQDQRVPYGIDLVRARDTWDADRDGLLDEGAPNGAGIRVCVVDTGISAAHEDLGGGGVSILAGISFVGEDWANDLQGHGTHVAGTVAAMNNNVGVVGVSPGQVDLLIADVFNDAGESQASSTILAAAEWCADQGADIISMSLGGLVGTLADGYQAIYDRGVLIIAAAGNDGGPVFNFPASYPAAVSVAAIDSTETVASFSNFVPTVEVAAPGVAVTSTYPFENSMAVASGPTFQGNAIANADAPGTYTGILADGGDCNTAPAPGSFTGKVVLCERGNATFRVKIDNAAAGGATAAVIYNNAPGNFNGTYGDPCCASIPSISLSQSDGQEALGLVGQEVTVTVQLQSTAGYADLSGTSMATPHASGTAAVIWSACPELTNDQVRSHLSFFTRESVTDPVPGRDIFYGHGIVQLKDAVDGLFDGVDGYIPEIGNPTGDNPANVECPTQPGQEGGAKTTGGGWLQGDSGKINFGFQVREVPGSAQGELQLNDHGAGIKIHINAMTSLQGAALGCGPLPAGSGIVEFTGNGSINGAQASFRVCAADQGEPGKGNDLFYLECTSGCSYETAGQSSDSVIDGGNIQVHASSEAEAGGAASAATVVLDPLLLTQSVAGQTQLFYAQVYDQNQRPLSDATVESTRLSADGSVETFTGVTNLNGVAVISVIQLQGVSEYRAVSGTAESNAVRLDAR